MLLNRASLFTGCKNIFIVKLQYNKTECNIELFVIFQNYKHTARLLLQRTFFMINFVIHSCSWYLGLVWQWRQLLNAAPSQPDKHSQNNLLPKYLSLQVHTVQPFSVKPPQPSHHIHNKGCSWWLADYTRFPLQKEIFKPACRKNPYVEDVTVEENGKSWKCDIHGNFCLIFVNISVLLIWVRGFWK